MNGNKNIWIILQKVCLKIATRCEAQRSSKPIPPFWIHNIVDHFTYKFIINKKTAKHKTVKFNGQGELCHIANDYSRSKTCIKMSHTHVANLTSMECRHCFCFLPGHPWVSQLWLSELLPWQLAPPLDGEGLVQVRVRFCDPPSHDWLHWLQVPHWDQLPFTVVQNFKKQVKLCCFPETEIVPVLLWSSCRLAPFWHFAWDFCVR